MSGVTRPLERGFKRAVTSEVGQVAIVGGATVAGAAVGGPVGAMVGAQLGSTVVEGINAREARHEAKDVEREARQVAQQEAAAATAAEQKTMADERAAAVAAGRRRDRLLRVSALQKRGLGTAGVSFGGSPVTGAGILSSG